jgi:hypothetical protein
MSGRAAFTLTPEQLAEVETLAAVLNAEQIADYFGVGRTTFFSMMRRDEEIAARYKRGKARAIGAIAQGLIQKARSGDTTSMIFYLKTQGGWRETMQIEQRNDEPAEARPDYSKLSDEDLMRLIGIMDKVIDPEEKRQAELQIHEAQT